jgi:hypothetical protein
MINKLTLIALVFILFSCREQTKENNVKSDNLDSMKTKVEILDSLRNPNSNSYFTDLNTKEFAKLILADSIKPSDNKSTYRVMDSIEAKSFEDREYYFKVFIKIIDKSDGALSEVIGSRARLYVEKHTKEFLKFASLINDKEFESFAQFVGQEFVLENSDTILETRKEYYSKLLDKNCKDCSFIDKNKLKKFIVIMNKEFDANKE